MDGLLTVLLCCIQVALRMENAEPFLWSMFEGYHASTVDKPPSQTESASRGMKRNETSEDGRPDQQERVLNDDCKSDILSPLKAKVNGQIWWFLAKVS